MSRLSNISEALNDSLWTDSELDSSGLSPANVADALFAIARSIEALAIVGLAIAEAIKQTESAAPAREEETTALAGANPLGLGK